MLLPVVLSCALAAVAALPVSYDERQDGEFNVRADVKNVMLVFALPKMGTWESPNLLSLIFSKYAHKMPEDSERESKLQERADVQVMEAFVEPSTPYRVEIGSESDRHEDGAGRAVEVVIAGRRHASAEPSSADELMLLGATEQCGPDRERDPVTLSCRARAAQPEDDSANENKNEPVAEKTEVVPASS